MIHMFVLLQNVALSNISFSLYALIPSHPLKTDQKQTEMIISPFWPSLKFNAFLNKYVYRNMSW